ncbi:MAG: hypothetical protein HC867_06490 [Bacteroidia bacterium]|nr:hypothetical protein [Bacteroidia bacterium]
MRFLKPLMIGITGLAIVILLITSLLPNAVMTSEGIMIHAPKDTVLQVVKQIEGWKDWNLLIGDKTPELSEFRDDVDRYKRRKKSAKGN